MRFVSDGAPRSTVPATYRLASLRSLADEMRAQGLAITTQVLRVQMHQMIKRVADSLGLEAGTRGLRLERLRIVGTHPVAHQVSWVVPPYAEEIEGADFARVPLYSALAATCGVSVVSATEVIRPELLSASLAPLLRRTPGSPVFISERVTFTARQGADEVPVVYDTAVIDGHRMRIHADRGADGLSLEWKSAAKAGE